jgi:hypothetical protein
LRKTWVIGLVWGITGAALGAAVTFALLSRQGSPPPGKAADSRHLDGSRPDPPPEELGAARLAVDEFLERKRDAPPGRTEEGGLVRSNRMFDCRNWTLVGDELAPTRDELLCWGVLDGKTCVEDSDTYRDANAVFSLLAVRNPGAAGWAVQAYCIRPRRETPWDPGEVWRSAAVVSDPEGRWARRLADTFLLHAGLAANRWVVDVPDRDGVKPWATAGYQRPTAGYTYAGWNMDPGTPVDGGQAIVFTGRVAVRHRWEQGSFGTRIKDVSACERSFVLRLRRSATGKWRVAEFALADQ